jgi:hypothetical protein
MEEGMKRDPLEYLHKQLDALLEGERDMDVKMKRRGENKVADAYARGKMYALWRCMLAIEEMRATPHLWH